MTFSISQTLGLKCAVKLKLKFSLIRGGQEE